MLLQSNDDLRHKATSNQARVRAEHKHTYSIIQARNLTASPGPMGMDGGQSN